MGQAGYCMDYLLSSSAVTAAERERAVRFIAVRCPRESVRETLAALGLLEEPLVLARTSVLVAQGSQAHSASGQAGRGAELVPVLAAGELMDVDDPGAA